MPYAGLSLVKISYACQSLDNSHFGNICKGDVNSRTVWQLGAISDWAGKCQEKCTNHGKQSGCCEVRTSGLCLFYPEGNEHRDAKYKDAKAVLCQSTGKMKNSCPYNN